MAGGEDSAEWFDGAARDWDDATLDGVIRAHQPYVERLLTRLLGPRADLEDLSQTVFMEFCRALPRFRGDARLSTFLGGITVNVARRAMRPSAYRRFRAEMPAEVASDARGPFERCEASDALARVRQALEGVGPNKRVAFLLWALEGMSPAEIASLTGASLSATRSRIFHAQRELRSRARRDPVLCELVEGRDGSG